MTDTPAFTKGPWKVGYRALDVLAPSAKGGETKVCDIRGWGYLTGKGHGALGLSDDEAVAIQTANARLIAAAPDMYEALIEARETILDLKNARGSEAEGTDAEWVAKIDAALSKAGACHD